MTIWCEMPLASRRTSFRVAEAERPGAILLILGKLSPFAGVSDLGVERDAREMIECAYILGPESVNDFPRVRKNGLEESAEEPS